MACEINRREALFFTLAFASCMQGKNSIVGQCNIICTFSVKLVRIHCKSGAVYTQQKTLERSSLCWPRKWTVRPPVPFLFLLVNLIAILSGSERLKTKPVSNPNFFMKNQSQLTPSLRKNKFISSSKIPSNQTPSYFWYRSRQMNLITKHGKCAKR